MSEQKNNENDINELLDNALQDFSPVSTGTATGDAKPATSVAAPDGVVANGAEGGEDLDAFLMEHAQALADRMNVLFGGAETPSGDVPPLPQDPDLIMAGFKKMAEAAAMTLQGENTAKEEDVAKYSDSIAQAMKGLREGTDSLAAPVAETDLANLMGGLNLEGDGEGNMFLPFMEAMMMNLLSAEVLLPSVKELLDKYPKYFEENGDKLSAEDKERYEKQQELFKSISDLLESERPDDSAAVKIEKHKVVLASMRKLQEYGTPPKEITDETSGDFAIMDPSMMGGAGANPQCPTM